MKENKVRILHIFSHMWIVFPTDTEGQNRTASGLLEEWMNGSSTLEPYLILYGYLLYLKESSMT